jgi:hypothetical protein
MASTSDPTARCAAARSRPVRLRTTPRGTSASNPATDATRGGLRKPCDASWHSWSPPRGKEFGKKGKSNASFRTQGRYQYQKTPQVYDVSPRLEKAVRKKPPPQLPGPLVDGSTDRFRSREHPAPLPTPVSIRRLRSFCKHYSVRSAQPHFGPFVRDPWSVLRWRNSGSPAPSEPSFECRVVGGSCSSAGEATNGPRTKDSGR